MEVLQQVGMTSMMSILRERRLRWLGHVRRMDPGRIPKDLLYGQLAVGTRPTGRPCLRYKDVCKRDLKQCQIDVLSWERLAEDRALWRLAVRKEMHVGEDARNEGVPTTTTINFHMCEVPERLPFTGRATQPPLQMPLTQPGTTPSSPKTEGCRRRRSQNCSFSVHDN